MKKNSLIYIACHEGLIGSAIVRNLKKKGYKNLLWRSKKKLDLTNQRTTELFFKKFKPEYVFLPSIKEGGILANSIYPADFIYQNIMAQSNVINSAYKYGTKKLLFLGSACSYPRICRQPIKEEYLLTDLLEPTNESYAIAKISGLKMCQAYNRQYKTNFISAIPTNTYGPYDNFEEEGHVIAGLIKKFHQAKIKNGVVKIWGTGRPKREFLYVNDVADACLFLMNKYNENEVINIAGAKEVSIRQLVDLLKKITGFKGKIVYDTKKPDGIPRRLLGSAKISKIGWRAKIDLKEGLELTYQWYQKKYGKKLETN